jgi:hemerythrin-like domain-containing protein
VNTVSEYLNHDHRRLDALLDRVLFAVRETALSEASRHLAEFASGLERHIDLEERVLFPAFEAKTGMRVGPTAVMRIEHADLRCCLVELDDALCANSRERALEALDALVDALVPHNEKEERVLYPMIERVLGSAQASADLVRDMIAT